MKLEWMRSWGSRVTLAAEAFKFSEVSAEVLGIPREVAVGNDGDCFEN